MTVDSFMKRFIKKAKVQGWLSEDSLEKLDALMETMETAQPWDVIKKIQAEKLLTEGQIEQIEVQLQEEEFHQIELPPTPAIIYMNNIVKTYETPEGTFRALKEITLTVHRGEILAILGFSGSGKSTLLNILGLLSTADEGSRIFYNGISYANMNAKQRDELRKREFSFIFQESHLLNHLNAIENVALPLRLQNWSNTDCIEKARVTLEKFMTDSEKETKEIFFHKKPSQFSGGQKQRIAAARAMVHDPKVIFADEPTGNLDFDTGHLVMEALLKAAKEKKASVILVTHNPSQARQYCHRFVWLENGELKTHLASAMDSTIRMMKRLSGKNLNRR